MGKFFISDVNIFKEYGEGFIYIVVYIYVYLGVSFCEVRFCVI